MGHTNTDVLTKMQDYIEQLALANEWTIDEAVAQLTQQYDGYHFTWPSSDIFNPFSLLNAMQDNLPIVKVGINFDSEQRTISDWEIVRE